MDDSYRQIWQRIKDRDREAFGELYDLYFSRLYMFALKKTGREEAAKDIVQESFLKLWDKAPETDRLEKSLEAWLVTIVRNTCYDWLRKQQTKQTHHARLHYLRGGEVHRDQHLWELVSRIDRAYAEMPEKTLDIFLMSREEGLTYQEIAERVELSVKSVEFHISKALGILREALKDYL